jgi:two-component system, chemotaxis family, chemotaxis protein CheY
MPATILIVDDSKTVRGLIRGALMADRHLVVEAPGAREALAALDEGPVDLVITDVNMPEIDGLTLVRTLRTRPRERFTPVLVLTTEGGEAMKQQGREAGATGWLVKPFDSDQLRQTVRRVLAARAR